MNANKLSPGKGERRANMANHKVTLARQRASAAKPRVPARTETTRSLELALRRADADSKYALYFGVRPIHGIRLVRDPVLRRIHIYFETR